jgi:hypothetical protein
MPTAAPRRWLARTARAKVRISQISCRYALCPAQYSGATSKLGQHDGQRPRRSRFTEADNFIAFTVATPDRLGLLRYVRATAITSIGEDGSRLGNGLVIIGDEAYPTVETVVELRSKLANIPAVPPRSAPPA